MVICLILTAYTSTGYLEWDDVSFLELGWPESTNIYNGVIAQGGTVLRALQSAAMWCYYNNNPLNGAVYGKLYNWYAAQAIAANPPAGWRVPTEADWTELATYLGGASVAGGKMKKEGELYFSPNTGATNESGFTGLGGGYRAEDNGLFYSYTVEGRFTVTNKRGAILRRDLINLNIEIPSPAGGRGQSLRLLRNEP